MFDDFFLTALLLPLSHHVVCPQKVKEKKYKKIPKRRENEKLSLKMKKKSKDFVRKCTFAVCPSRKCVEWLPNKQKGKKIERVKFHFCLILGGISCVA